MFQTVPLSIIRNFSL